MLRIISRRTRRPLLLLLQLLLLLLLHALPVSRHGKVPARGPGNVARRIHSSGVHMTPRVRLVTPRCPPVRRLLMSRRRMGSDILLLLLMSRHPA